MKVTLTKNLGIENNLFSFDCVDEKGNTFHCTEQVSSKKALGTLALSEGMQMDIEGFGSPSDYHILKSKVILVKGI